MLVVSSVFDSLRNESVMVTMNENDGTAIREFCHFMSSPDFRFIKNDLILYKFGEFDIHTLEFIPCEKTVLKVGSDVETVDGFLVDSLREACDEKVGVDDEIDED